jgi:hypothetical protein
MSNTDELTSEAAKLRLIGRESPFSFRVDRCSRSHADDPKQRLCRRRAAPLICSGMPLSTNVSLPPRRLLSRQTASARGSRGGRVNLRRQPWLHCESRAGGAGDSGYFARAKRAAKASSLLPRSPSPI